MSRRVAPLIKEVWRADRSVAHRFPAYHLAGFVTGLKDEVLSADLARFVEGRLLDDNAHHR